jgi:hypothetical protein
LNLSLDGRSTGSRPIFRAALDKVLAEPLGQDLAAGAVGLFQNENVDLLAVDLGSGLEVDRRGKAGDPAADDDDFRHQNPFLSQSRRGREERQVGGTRIRTGGTCPDARHSALIPLSSSGTQ